MWHLSSLLFFVACAAVHGLDGYEFAENRERGGYLDLEELFRIFSITNNTMDIWH